MIKIKNIYYMLAYAFQVLNEDSYAKVEVRRAKLLEASQMKVLVKAIAYSP